jgi:6-phosphofructokinase 2
MLAAAIRSWRRRDQRSAGDACAGRRRSSDLSCRRAGRPNDDTSGAALKQAREGIYLLKPSLRELQDLVGREIGSPLAQEKAAREVIEQGRTEIVVLSLGAEGALLATAQGCERFAAVPVEARSTVGAGDSMLAGVVLGLSREMPVREAVRFGLAAGAAALL